MTALVTNSLNDAKPLLASGGLAVIPTDTLYGVVASTNQPAAVQRLYNLRRSDATKPFVILAADLTDLAGLQVELPRSAREYLSHVWPGPVSVVLPCPSDDMSYLHRGLRSLAIRIPAPEPLRAFLRTTGPLAAPSANPPGQSPATTIPEAQAYFGDQVDIYVDGGARHGAASQLARLDNHGRPTILRP